MTNASQGAKKAAAAIRKILWADWDPIGCGVPEDEYDAYVWPTLGLLQRGASAAEVADYLRVTANESIGMAVPEDRLQRVVDKLVALKTGGGLIG